MVAHSQEAGDGDWFAGVARREFDLLLIWWLDRCSRGGMAATMGHLQRLSSHGVGFHLLATLTSLAKLERKKISQRTKAGLERARAMGKRLGRVKFSDGDRQKLRTALDTGSSWHAVSLATKIPYSTVKKHTGLMGYEPRQLDDTKNRNGDG